MIIIGLCFEHNPAGLFKGAFGKTGGVILFRNRRNFNAMARRSELFGDSCEQSQFGDFVIIVSKNWPVGKIIPVGEGAIITEPFFHQEQPCLSIIFSALHN